MLLTDFPIKGGEGIYRAKVRRSGAQMHLMVHKQMVKDLDLKADQSYMLKMKRIRDAYSEENLLVELKDSGDADHPLRASLPASSMMGSGDKLYISLEPFDLTKWFKNKKSKGFGLDDEVGA